MFAAHITTNARGKLQSNNTDKFHAKTKTTKFMEKLALVNKTEFLCCRFLFAIFVHDVIYVDINKGTEAASHIHWSWNHSDQKIIFFLSVTNTK